jgi:phosphoserine phosphatase RsbU/P
LASAPTEAELLRYVARASRKNRDQGSRPAGDLFSALSSPLVSSSILVAEDDRDTRALITRLLEKAGYQVLQAEDGEQVFEILEKQTPGLLLLDCQMPRLDGFGVCTRLKANPDYADLPVVFLTALSDPKDKARGFEVGGEDYVTKPIERRELLARIHTRLELAMSRRALRRKASLFEAVSIESADRLNDVRTGQASLLSHPAAFPELKLGVRFQPAHEAGGDFYEIARLSEDDFGLLVSDVSGHDLSVPFITGALKALAATFLNESLTPTEVLSLHNASLLRFLSEERYVTACYARFSRLSMEVEVASAAHPPALFQSATGETGYIDLAGDVLGMFDPGRYDSKRFPVVPGDRLFLYTDGLIEGYRDADGQYGVVRGMERLRKALIERQSMNVTEVVDAVVEELLGECDGMADDDIVLMGIEF